MEYSKKYRLALTGLIIMVVLNIGTVVTIWMILPPPRAILSDDAGPGRIQRFLMRELNLSEQQLDELQQLRQEHFREVQSLMNEIQKSRNTYFDLLKAADSSVVNTQRDSLANRIGRYRAQLEKANYDHFIKVRALLSNEQKSRFDTILQQTIRRRGRGHMGSGPGLRRPGGGMF